MTFDSFARALVWLDGRPLLAVIEPYRLRFFERFFERDSAGRLIRNLGLKGCAKKNWKTADEIIAAIRALAEDPAPGYDSECYLLANDGDQARDDLSLAKKLIKANPLLQSGLTIKRDSIERKDGRGFLQVLPAGDVVGQHGKSYRFCGYDEIHGYRTWDIFEAMQPDPHRPDAQQWITSYASIHHRPGVPLFDLVAMGKAGADPRMLFSWYAADFTTDPEFLNKSPEERANPSMGSWADPDYLRQQQRRLPAHKFRRLHLNLPGLPDGSAFAPEPIMDAVDRGVLVRAPETGVRYSAFVDMSGGSSDDAMLAIAHRDGVGRAVLDVIQDQGPRPPFDPNKAVSRFVSTLREYRCARVVGDRYAGETFKAQFEAACIGYTVCPRSASELYEAFEPALNAGQVRLLDVPIVEQQLLGLLWRGASITHSSGEHDDAANAAVGVLLDVLDVARMDPAMTMALLRAGDHRRADLAGVACDRTHDAALGPAARRRRDDDDSDGLGLPDCF